MKRIVLIVVGALVAIAMIPIIVISINRITQEKVRDEVVTFEVLTLDGSGNGTVTSGTVNKVLSFAKVDNFIATNTVSILINDIETLSEDFYLRIDLTIPNISLYNGDDGDGDFITINDQLSTSLGLLTLNDVVSITFEVTTPAQVTGVGAALLNLVPILFVLGTVFSLVIFTKELE